MQLKFVTAILVALVPIAVATSISSPKCDASEFKWEPKNCCLPKGGPKVTPTPPKNTECPPTTHYWEAKQGCCVPRNLPPRDDHPPQCNKDWTWNKSLYRCDHNPTPTNPPHTQPSYKPGQHHRRAASHKSRETLCPTNLDACPVSSLSGDYECLDTSSELESCGGCSSMGEGQDCLSIKGAWNVGCEQGSCRVYSCSGGFRIGSDKKSCIEL